MRTIIEVFITCAVVAFIAALLWAPLNKAIDHALFGTTNPIEGVHYAK